MNDAILEYDLSFYGLAVIFLLTSVLLLVLRDDPLVPLVFAILSIGVLLIIPAGIFVLEHAPWVPGARLSSGSRTQLLLVSSPVVALVGWLVAAFAVARARSRSAPRTGDDLPRQATVTGPTKDPAS